jgi:hypothetical protein
VEGQGSQYGNCESYATTNAAFCASDTSLSGVSVMDDCPISCKKCTVEQEQPAPAPGAAWDGVCPDGNTLFRVSGANDIFGTQVGECVEMCTPTKVYTSRLISLLAGAKINERCSAEYSPYTNYWWPVTMDSFEFQCTIATCGSEVTLNENVNNVHKWGRGEASVTEPPDNTGNTDGVEDGFDFGSGCAAGSGYFERDLPTAGEAFDVGFIPAGKFDVFVKLAALGDTPGDIDIQLFDFDNKGEEGKTC